jgi:hypothetical protein
MGGDDAGEGRREDPEHHQPEAHHADGAVEELAVEAQLALEVDRPGEDDDEADPDRCQPAGHAPMMPLASIVGISMPPMM